MTHLFCLARPSIITIFNLTYSGYDNRIDEISDNSRQEQQFAFLSTAGRCIVTLLSLICRILNHEVLCFCSIFAQNNILYEKTSILVVLSTFGFHIM